MYFDFFVNLLNYIVADRMVYDERMVLHKLPTLTPATEAASTVTEGTAPSPTSYE